MSLDLTELMKMDQKSLGMLEARGVKEVDQLIEYGITRIKLRRRLTGKQNSWFEQALFNMINGVDIRSSILIEKGITVRNINNRSPKAIRGDFESVVQNSLSIDVPSESEIISWQKQAIKLANTPIIVFKITNNLAHVNYSKLTLRVNSKKFYFSSNGICIIHSMPSWRLVAKLYHDNTFVDRLDFRNSGQFTVKKISYSSSRLKSETKGTLISNNITLRRGQRLNIVRVTKEDLEENQKMFGKKNENGDNYFILSDYKVVGNNFIFSVFYDDTLDIADQKEYVFSNNEISGV